MDIGELINYKPETIPKRKQDDDEGEDPRAQASSINKRQRFDEKILESIRNDDDTEESQALDENGLKKLALLFEKRVLKNQVTRLKFSEPEKFMESEVNLINLHRVCFRQILSFHYLPG